jgi:arylsulfatase A-like enzyme
VARQQRVVVIGVDGANWTVMGPMIEDGELPTFARMDREGASMRRLGTLKTTSSPLVWTSAATGQTPKKHGIEDYVEVLPDGSKVPITSNSRKVKAIWNVVTEHDLSVGVIGWWASWPAETVNGYVVSDHANPATAGWMMEGEKYWTANPEALAAHGHDVYPPELDLSEHWIAPDAFPKADFLARSQVSEPQLEQVMLAPWNKRTPYSWLKTFYAVDKPYADIAKRLTTEKPTDLQMLYVRGPDPLQHYAWDLVEPDEFARKPEHLDRDLGIVQGVYRYVDTFLAELLANQPEGVDTTVIVLSDHGAEPAKDADDPERTDRPGRHTRAAKGVMFITGPHVQTGKELEDATPMDLAPTVAWLLGLPVADDLAGRPLTEAFSEDFVTWRGQQSVPTWGEREVQAGLASPGDDVMLESLRGLGYIE